MKRRFIWLTTSVLILAALVGIFPEATFGEEGGSLQPFGGKISYMMPCTCGEPNLWLFMAPLHLGAPIPITGPLVYSPSRTKLHDMYMVVPSSWLLGLYEPGTQSCQIYVGTACAVLPSLGEIFKTGTSDVI